MREQTTRTPGHQENIKLLGVLGELGVQFFITAAAPVAYVVFPKYKEEGTLYLPLY